MYMILTSTTYPCHVLQEDTQLYNLNELVPQLVNQDSELLLALGWVQVWNNASQIDTGACTTQFSCVCVCALCAPQNLHADIESAEAKLRELKDTLTVFHRDQVRHSAHAKLHSAIKKATLMRQDITPPPPQRRIACSWR